MFRNITFLEDDLGFIESIDVNADNLVNLASFINILKQKTTEAYLYENWYKSECVN
jgi:hypothetical protein